MPPNITPGVRDQIILPNRSWIVWGCNHNFSKTFSATLELSKLPQKERTRPEKRAEIEKKYVMVLNKILTPILDLCKQHQTGRVSEKLTNVSFDFTEGWFRTSGLYDLNRTKKVHPGELYVYQIVRLSGHQNYLIVDKKTSHKTKKKFNNNLFMVPQRAPLD